MASSLYNGRAQIRLNRGLHQCGAAHAMAHAAPFATGRQPVRRAHMQYDGRTDLHGRHVMSIEVGTASWTDATLIKSGRFYPKGCTSAEARLRFYASQFSLVELDASYYALPSAANSALWVERTPSGFTFNVKAFRLFTGHQTEPKF